MLYGGHPRFGYSLAASSFLLLSRLLLLFRASRNNYCAVIVFPKSGACFPTQFRPSWKQSYGSPGEQFALPARKETELSSATVVSLVSQ